MQFRLAISTTALALLIGGLSAPIAHAEAPEPRATQTATACVPSLFDRPANPAYAATTWPTEHADVWRSHSAAAGLPSTIGPRSLHAEAIELPPVPVWGYVGEGKNIFVVGGAPYLLDMFTKLMQGAPESSAALLVAKSKVYARSMTPYIARINSKTLNVDVLPLPKGVSANYTGGALVHANGSLYAVARSVLYKIDPKSFSIVKSKNLPLAPNASGEPNRQTAYNGMVATANGDLILKGWASTGGGSEPPGILLRISPKKLAIKAKTVTTQVASARMAVVSESGQEYLYFPNQTQSVRFALTSTDFVFDSAWGATYLQSGTGMTTASSDVFMGNGVVFSDNTDPNATAPINVFAQGIGSGSTLSQTAAFTSTNPGWNFFMMAGDPYVSGISVVEDQLNPQAAGFMVCGGGQSVQKIWENTSIAPSAGMAINSKAGHLYTDDRVCAKNGKCKVYLVVLNLKTGEEISRVRVKADKPSVGQIFIGPKAVYYVATNTNDPNGYVTKVTASH